MKTAAEVQEMRNKYLDLAAKEFIEHITNAFYVEVSNSARTCMSFKAPETHDKDLRDRICTRLVCLGFQAEYDPREFCYLVALPSKV